MKRKNNGHLDNKKPVKKLNRSSFDFSEMFEAFTIMMSHIPEENMFEEQQYNENQEKRRVILKKIHDYWMKTSVNQYEKTNFSVTRSVITQNNKKIEQLFVDIKDIDSDKGFYDEIFNIIILMLNNSDKFSLRGTDKYTVECPWDYQKLNKIVIELEISEVIKERLLKALDKSIEKHTIQLSNLINQQAENGKVSPLLTKEQLDALTKLNENYHELLNIKAKTPGKMLFTHFRRSLIKSDMEYPNLIQHFQKPVLLFTPQAYNNQVISFSSYQRNVDNIDVEMMPDTDTKPQKVLNK